MRGRADGFYRRPHLPSELPSVNSNPARRRTQQARERLAWAALGAVWMHLLVGIAAFFLDVAAPWSPWWPARFTADVEPLIVLRLPDTVLPAAPPGSPIQDEPEATPAPLAVRIVEPRDPGRPDGTAANGVV